MARRGEGLRVRLKAINGTNKRCLRQPLYFPAVLGDFTVEEDATHRDYETIGAGEYSQPSGGSSSTARRLRTVDLESLTLDWDAGWLVEKGVDPDRVKTELKRLLRYRTPFELLATLSLSDSTEPELLMNGTIRRLSMTLKPGETDTRYFALSITEWRDASVKRRSSSQSRRKGVKLPTTHKLDSNDTLNRLSRQYYGTTTAWRTIAEANNIRTWGPTTLLIKMRRYKVGSKIKIPRKPPIATINSAGEAD